MQFLSSVTGNVASEICILTWHSVSKRWHRFYAIYAMDWFSITCIARGEFRLVCCSISYWNLSLHLSAWVAQNDWNCFSYYFILMEEKRRNWHHAVRDADAKMQIRRKRIGFHISNKYNICNLKREPFHSQSHTHTRNSHMKPCTGAAVSLTQHNNLLFKTCLICYAKSRNANRQRL